MSRSLKKCFSCINVILLPIILFTSCQHGFYVPRTVNVPQLDSNKTSDFGATARLLPGVVEFQHNHLFFNRFVFQNNYSFRLDTWQGFGGMGEGGLGYYLDKKYNNLIMAGTGYSYQDYEYLHSGWIDGSYVDVIAHDQRNIYLQFSKRIGRFEDVLPSGKFWPKGASGVFIYSRTDYCRINGVKLTRNQRMNVPYLVQDFGGSVYISPLKIYACAGVNLSYTRSEHLDRLVHPLLNNHIYMTLALKF